MLYEKQLYFNCRLHVYFITYNWEYLVIILMIVFFDIAHYS